MAVSIGLVAMPLPASISDSGKFAGQATGVSPLSPGVSRILGIKKSLDRSRSSTAALERSWELVEEFNKAESVETACLEPPFTSSELI